MINLEFWRDRRNSTPSVHAPWDHAGRDLDHFAQLFDTDPKSGGRDLVTACDIHEGPDAFLLSVDMPGIALEDIVIDVQGQILQIAAHRHQKTHFEGSRKHHSERKFGEFRRTFALPETIDEDGIEATFQNGVLSISLPKLADEKPKRITVRDAAKPASL